MRRGGKDREEEWSGGEDKCGEEKKRGTTLDK